MSEPGEKRTLAPHVVIIAIIVVVILAVLLWPSNKPEEEVVDEPVVSEQETLDVEEPEIFEPTPEPEPVEIDPDAEVEPMPALPEIEPEPMDTTDDGIRTSLKSLNEEAQTEELLVDEGLMQRFVVSVTNLSNDQMAPSHQLFKAPEQEFRTYKQAGKEWVDAASYKRYTPYVNLLESFENEALIDLYGQYKGDIQAKYAEIGNPDKPFNEVMIEAINQLLDTPEVPVPVEVYSDSVTYKYADERLEELSSPQKQLLRTGPDNMRRIKAKLREVKALLEEQDGSE
ncbi:DUF3014 domain-containing protein [Alteromonas sp. ASW11-130]|uniref:DUF3014 domain-containing protein n=1 Tax=Alteromonas sp. ASW11-130 TaxID=3015775 RepID=UPI00224284A8|nr:DUF3014 domain-containing protein [Alteromonas sp. ASW11-130]MCW8093374.1 DUF3014 domain-containing protein [Alteromonas sp. ASW11-130]